MIMQYLKATKILDITYSGTESGNLIIKGYSNSDQMSNNTTRKSISRFIFMLNKGLVSQYSKKQATVAFSLTKAKYMALTLVEKEATWIRLLLTEVSLLNKKGQYTEIKVIQESKRVEQIKTNVEK